MSPGLLGVVNFAYRVEGVPETRLITLDRMEHLKEALAKGDIARLYEGGWMEDAMFYKEGRPEEVVLEEDAPADGTEGPPDLGT